MYRKKIVIIIFGILVVSFLCPVLLEIFVFRNDIPSALSNGEWSSFLGSFIGGVIGGVGTLFAVYFSISETRVVQNESLEVIDYDRKMQIYKERKAHTDEIAQLISKYVSNYEVIIKKMIRNNELCIEVNKCKHDINSLCEEIDAYSRFAYDEESIRLSENQTKNLVFKKDILERELKYLKEEKSNNIIDFGELLNCSFLIRMKINNNYNSEVLVNLINKLDSKVNNDGLFIFYDGNKREENKTDITELMNSTTAYIEYYLNEFCDIKV